MVFPDLNEIADHLVRELTIQKPVIIRRYPYTTAKCTCRERKGRYLVRISNFFEDTPPEIITAVVAVVLSRSAGKPSEQYLSIYRKYMNTNGTKLKLEDYRSVHAGKVLRGGVGRVHDLTVSFGRVNSTYFQNRISDVTLTWGRRSKRTLGHYDPAMRTIVVSSILDRRTVPVYLVDYIVFHELLHHEIPSFYRNGRRVIHSPEFKRREKEFSRFADAKRLMRKL